MGDGKPHLRMLSSSDNCISVPMAANVPHCSIICLYYFFLLFPFPRLRVTDELRARNHLDSFFPPLARGNSSPVSYEKEDGEKGRVYFGSPGGPRDSATHRTGWTLWTSPAVPGLRAGDYCSFRADTCNGRVLVFVSRIQHKKDTLVVRANIVTCSHIGFSNVTSWKAMPGSPRKMKKGLFLPHLSLLLGRKSSPAALPAVQCGHISSLGVSS